MDIIVHPSYFPSISQFAAMVQASSITFEFGDNYQKQTNRNRTFIYSANGKQMLNIPVKHSKNAHQLYKDVKIENAFNWQKQHLKSLEASYRTSPYFEYFEDDINPIFFKKHSFLLDLNLQIHEIITSCLGQSLPYQESTEYLKDPSPLHDFRNLINGKKDQTEIESYVQVFQEKYGFINNLSILDLLFNEGRHSIDYLKNQKILDY